MSDQGYTRLKYVKIYLGVVTGSYAGRDDGYPEVKHKLYDNLEELAADPTIEDETIYELHVCTPHIATLISQTRERLALQKKSDERAEKEKLFEKLKHELGK